MTYHNVQYIVVMETVMDSEVDEMIAPLINNCFILNRSGITRFC